MRILSNEGWYLERAQMCSVAQELQFDAHPANIDAWTFGPVVAAV